ncbi:serine/threonine-protein kinase Nek4-like [Haliotis rufescens]|uniref:serine/threonine-protein kinase Nek4-like n=1 Tax=Haliotis rufescens TaxID=6454 RepID=UPI00201F2669|nr:serine/threonine-protein kinase Nek4-like [Haliotis rufescens]
MGSDYKIIRELGKGAFGTVYLIKHKTAQEWFALKTVDLSNANSEERASAEKEANLMRELDHDHVVRYVASTFNGSTLFIFTEYCEGGDLSHFLEDSSGKLPEDLIVCWVYQTALALEYLHRMDILHRDLKPQNIYLTGEGDVKLGDLGIARILANGMGMATTMAGTPFYMSPEIFEMKGYDHKTDIWSFGCVVYEMATREHAFDATNMPCLIYTIVAGKVPAIHASYSGGLRQLVKSMMDKDPDERPGAEELLNHSPIKEFGDNLERPRTIMKKFKFRTKWGTGESTVDVSKMFQAVELNTSPSFREQDICIPIDSLVLQRKRLGRPPPSDLYETIKANRHMPRMKTEETVDLNPSPGHAAVTQAVMLGLMGKMAQSPDTTLNAATILPASDRDRTGGMGTSTRKDIVTHVMLSQIQRLQKDCAQGLGEDKLKEAYSILDSVPDAGKLKAHLVGLIGEDRYREYGEKIMYLRLFEKGSKKIG